MKYQDKSLRRYTVVISLVIALPFIVFGGVFQFIVRMFLGADIPSVVTSGENNFFMVTSAVHLIAGMASIWWLFPNRIVLIFPALLFTLSSYLWVYDTSIMITYQHQDMIPISVVGSISNLILFLMTTAKLIFINSFTYKPSSNEQTSGLN